MKPRSIAVALFASFTLFSLSQPRLSLTAFRTRDGIRIEGALNNETLAGTASSFQDDKAAHNFVLDGNVDLTIDGVRLRADEVIIHKDSCVVEPSGNVRVTAIN